MNTRSSLSGIFYFISALSASATFAGDFAPFAGIPDMYGQVLAAASSHHGCDQGAW